MLCALIVMKSGTGATEAAGVGCAAAGGATVELPPGAGADPHAVRDDRDQRDPYNACLPHGAHLPRVRRLMRKTYRNFPEPLCR